MPLRTTLMLVAGCVQLVQPLMPAPGQTLSLGQLTAGQEQLVKALWTRIFFSVPDTEMNLLLQAEKTSANSTAVDGSNVTQAWEAGRPTGNTMIRGMPVDRVTEDDLLWSVYHKEMEQQYHGDGVMARRGQYPRVSQQHLQLMLESVFSNTRSHQADAAMKNAVRMYITRKFYSYRLLSLNHVFQFKPIDLMPLMEALKAVQEQNQDSTVTVQNDDDEPIGVNVVGILPGEKWGTPADRLLVVGAHYDTFANSPGLDDNGSGVAALLETARALSEAGCRGQFSMLLVAFDLEEVGGAGSLAFIHQFLNEKVLRPAGWPAVQGAFILDTVMNYNASIGAQTVPKAWKTQMPATIERLDQRQARGDFLAAIYRRHVDQHLADAYQYHYRRLGDASRFRFELFDVDLPAERPSNEVLCNYMNAMRSDHSRFWYVSRGVNQTEPPATIPAVLLTDTGPFRGVMARCYHAACDSVHHLHHANADNLPFLVHSTQALVNTLVDLSGAQCNGQPLVDAPPPLPSGVASGDS